MEMFNPSSCLGMEVLEQLLEIKIKRVIAGSKLETENVRLELEPDELLKVELDIIRQSQEESYPKECKRLRNNEKVSEDSKLSTMNPFIDEKGVMRSCSRVVNAQYLATDTRFPIILDRKSWITWLIAGKFHEETKHCA